MRTFQTRCSSFSIVTNTISQVCFETHEAIAGTVPVHTDAIAPRKPPDFTVIILRGDSSAIVSCDRQQIAKRVKASVGHLDARRSLNGHGHTFGRPPEKFDANGMETW